MRTVAARQIVPAASHRTYPESMGIDSLPNLENVRDPNDFTGEVCGSCHLTQIDCQLRRHDVHLS